MPVLQAVLAARTGRMGIPLGLLRGKGWSSRTRIMRRRRRRRDRGMGMGGILRESGGGGAEKGMIQERPGRGDVYDMRMPIQYHTKRRRCEQRPIASRERNRISPGRGGEEMWDNGTGSGTGHTWGAQNGIPFLTVFFLVLFYFSFVCIWAVTLGCGWLGGWVWFGLAASKHILFAHIFLRESSFSFLGPSSAVPFCFVSVRSVRFSHVWQAEERAGFEEGTDGGRTLGPRFGSSRPPPPFLRFWSFFTFRLIFASTFSSRTCFTSCC